MSVSKEGQGRFLCLIAPLLLSGCVAEMVQKSPPRKSTVPGVGYIDTGGGDVRYSADGWGIVVYLRRRTALIKLRELCRGKDLTANITDEFTHNDVIPIYSGEELDVNIQRGLEQYHVAPYHHIVFECKPVNGPAIKPAPEKPKT